jgi:hypothetical protein
VLASEVGLLVNVNLGQKHLAIMRLDNPCQDGLENAAWRAPGRCEVHKHGHLGLNNLLLKGIMTAGNRNKHNMMEANVTSNTEAEALRTVGTVRRTRGTRALSMFILVHILCSVLTYWPIFKPLPLRMPAWPLPNTRRGDVGDDCFNGLISSQEKFSPWIRVGLCHPNLVIEKTFLHAFLPSGSVLYELAVSLPHGQVVVYVGESRDLAKRMINGNGHLTYKGLFYKLLSHCYFDAVVELLVRVCQTEGAKSYEDRILKRLKYPANKKTNGMGPKLRDGTYDFDWTGLSSWIGL